MTWEGLLMCKIGRFILLCICFSLFTISCVSRVPTKVYVLKSIEVPDYMSKSTGRYDTLYKDIVTGEEFWQRSHDYYGLHGSGNSIYIIDRVYYSPGFTKKEQNNK